MSTVRLLPVQAAPSPMEARGNDITVEVGAMRLTVPPGFDRATLAAVLELVGGR